MYQKMLLQLLLAGMGLMFFNCNRGYYKYNSLMLAVEKKISCLSCLVKSFIMNNTFKKYNSSSVMSKISS